MKHIKEILSARRQMLFASHQSEKGSREWNAFNAVLGDRIEMFPVSTPSVREVPRYTNVVHISREPRHLTPKFGH